MPLVTSPVIEIDQVKTGKAMRRIREKHGFSLRQIGSVMDVSHQYVAELENGRRNWSEKLVRRYERAVVKLARVKERMS